MIFSLKNVSYFYSDQTPALSGIHFDVEQGESLAILGANGSGKSTLLRIMDGLYFPSDGLVEFDGQLITQDSLKDPKFQQRFRQSVGFVFQQADAQLFNATVYEEVAFGLRQLGMSESDIAERVFETLEFLGIRHLSDRAPFRLSGGEKRRAAIASVLVMNPKVILFDEPFLGLDPRGQTWLVQTIKQLTSAGKTIIVATHTLELVPRIAQKALILGEDHRLVAYGSVCEIFMDDQLLVEANLIESQKRIELP